MPYEHIYNVDEPRIHYMKTVSGRSQAQKVTRYDSIIVKQSDWVNPQRQTTDWWLPGAGGGEGEGVGIMA